MKINDLYNISLYLLKASKLLFKYDKMVSDDLLNLAEKYLQDVENLNLNKEDLKEIDKFTKMLRKDIKK